MNEIFISYASVDSEKIQPIVKALDDNSWNVWWDRKIPIDRTFDDVIEEAIGRSKCVIVVWSKESIKSQWVRAEASEGDRRGILIPVLLDNVSIPLAFRRIEAVRLMDWDGVSKHSELDKLLDAVAKLIGRPRVGKTEKKKPHRGDQLAAGSVNNSQIQVQASPSGATQTDPTSGDVFTLSGNFQGAIINIKSTLADTTQSVNATPNFINPLKEELTKLLEQLTESLTQVPADKIEEADAVAQAAKQLVENATIKKPNRMMIKISGDGLKQAAKNLTAVTPIILVIATQIVETIIKFIKW